MNAIAGIFGMRNRRTGASYGEQEERFARNLETPLTRFPRHPGRASSDRADVEQAEQPQDETPKTVTEVHLIVGANEADDEGVPISILRKALPERFDKMGPFERKAVEPDDDFFK